MTKAEFIEKLNASFPAEYPELARWRKRSILPEYPTVTKIEIGDVTHEHGTETDVHITFVLGSGIELTRTACIRDGHSFADTIYIPPSDSELDAEMPWLEDFCPAFVSHFSFWFMEDYLEYDEWESLPD